MTNGNGANPEAAPPPQLNVLAQYIKDLSFENPNAPQSLAPQGQPPQINIQINVGANALADTEFEVTLTIEGTDHGDSADHTIVLDDCTCSVDFAAGDPNSLSVSFTCYGTFTLT